MQRRRKGPGKERERERKREMAPTPFVKSKTPPRMVNAQATGTSDGAAKRAAAGREREDGERFVERNGEERPALLRVFGAVSGGGGGASFS